MQSFQQVEPGRREYQMAGPARMFVSILGLVFTLMGISAGALALHAPATGPIALVMVLVLGGMGAFMLAQAFRSRLVLDGSRLEVRGLFTTRSADRGEIEGYRTISSRNGSYAQLLLRDGRGAISIPNFFAKDDAYRAWLEPIPDLDQRDRQAMLDQISGDQELGSTPQERLQALASAKTWAVFLAIVTGVAMLSVFIAPVPFKSVAETVLMITPVIALWLLQRSPLLYAVFKPKADPRAELSVTLILASFGLLISCSGIHFISVTPLLIIIVPVGLFFAGALYVAANKGPSRAGTFFAMLFFVGMYSYGVGVLADTMPDRANATLYSVEVLDMHVSHGRRSTSYTLKLAPWGPLDSPRWVSVTHKLYARTGRGSDVCVHLHPGALRAAWYRVDDCTVGPQ